MIAAMTSMSGSVTTSTTADTPKSTARRTILCGYALRARVNGSARAPASSVALGLATEPIVREISDSTCYVLSNALQRIAFQQLW